MITTRPQPLAEEVIVQTDNRTITLLLAHDNITLARGQYSAGQPIAGAHIHQQHTDAFYVLEGELTVEIGCESEPVTLSAGDFIAVPPGVAHSLTNTGRAPVRALSIHARDGGFAAFMRGIRDGVDMEWDVAAVPPRGGRPARDAVVRRSLI